MNFFIQKNSRCSESFRGSNCKIRSPPDRLHNHDVLKKLRDPVEPHKCKAPVNDDASIASISLNSWANIDISNHEFHPNFACKSASDIRYVATCTPPAEDDGSISLNSWADLDTSRPDCWSYSALGYYDIKRPPQPPLWMPKPRRIDAHCRNTGRGENVHVSSLRKEAQGMTMGTSASRKGGASSRLNTSRQKYSCLAQAEFKTHTERIQHSLRKTKRCRHPTSSQVHRNQLPKALRKCITSHHLMPLLVPDL